jgi:signal transduction histidine kinase
VTFSSRGSGLLFGLRHPRTTVRWRLTLLYGGLFLASGAALLAITYGLVEHATVSGPGADFQRAVIRRGIPPQVTLRGGGPGFSVKGPGNVHVPVGTVPSAVKRLLRSRAGQAVVKFAGSEQRISDLHQLEIESVIALALMAIICGALGWVVAGRVLRPLRTMTAATQQISEANLHERLEMQGPRDELRKLADTIDELLQRLEGAFNAQRRFVANASHELRTPLTAARALLKMIISDPDATVETFRTTSEQVLEENGQQEQLIDALLALAHGQRGIDHRQPIDLAVIASDALHAHEPAAAARGVHLDVSLKPALISGDRRLIERLVSDLLENALRHNTPNGRVRVQVETRAGETELAVANTGPLVPADEVDRLLQPFQRLAVDRVGGQEGVGLGLSIVAAIANAHDAALDAHPGLDGGLEIEVRFPRAPDSDRPATTNDTSRHPQPNNRPLSVAAGIELGSSRAHPGAQPVTPHRVADIVQRHRGQGLRNPRGASSKCCGSRTPSRLSATPATGS